jgi:hypothetical protein
MSNLCDDYLSPVQWFLDHPWMMVDSSFEKAKCKISHESHVRFKSNWNKPVAPNQTP